LAQTFDSFSSSCPRFANMRKSIGIEASSVFITTIDVLVTSHLDVMSSALRGTSRHHITCHEKNVSLKARVNELRKGGIHMG
jgi:hypothetical protein